MTEEGATPRKYRFYNVGSRVSFSDEFTAERDPALQHLTFVNGNDEVLQMVGDGQIRFAKRTMNAQLSDIKVAASCCSSD